MAKSKRKHRKQAIISAFIVATLIGTASWALWALVNGGAQDLLSRIGVHNEYIQYGLVLIFVITILYLHGFTGLKALKKIWGIK